MSSTGTLAALSAMLVGVEITDDLYAAGLVETFNVTLTYATPTCKPTFWSEKDNWPNSQ